MRIDSTDAPTANKLFRVQLADRNYNVSEIEQQHCEEVIKVMEIYQSSPAHAESELEPSSELLESSQQLARYQVDKSHESATWRAKTTTSAF